MRRAWALAAALLMVAGCGSAHRLAKAASTASATTATTTTTSTTSTTVASTTTSKPTATTAVPRPTTTTHRAVAPTAGACPSNLASSLANTYSAKQLVTVESSSYGTDVATVTLWQKQGTCWQPAAGPWSGFIGYNGMTDSKREGDGKTPTGAYGFGPVIYGNASDPGVHEAYHNLVCGDWWDEDSSSPTYNEFQHVQCGTNPPFNNGSSEYLYQNSAYPVFAVIDYNTARVPGMGSAIFFHPSLGHGTAGCVSVALSDLDWFLRWMEPSQAPLIVMGPASEITRF